MSTTTFKTNPISLESLLKDCATGKIQLPDFQRSWVWAEDRIQSLISSVSSGYPIGALMTLQSRPGARPGEEAAFARRTIEGALPDAHRTVPQELLLDGQQRMTSLYQACMRRDVVTTITPKGKLVKRWFYIDIRKAIQPDADRDQAILMLPEDRRTKTNFDRTILLDLSAPEAEYEHLMFPLNLVFDWGDWQDGFYYYCFNRSDRARLDIFNRFKNEVLQNFKGYDVPVISLGPDSSPEAVCIVFEKVNTGGKPLDAFELLTAMYAARGHRLRDDWLGAPASDEPGLQRRLVTHGRAAAQTYGVLEKVASTDVLQSIALLHSKHVREQAAAHGVREAELPAVRATRQSLLDLPLDAYCRYMATSPGAPLKPGGSMEKGFRAAVQFLRSQHIYRVADLPYQTQIVPLAAILTEIGDRIENAANVAKIARWYWCGVFGELYGSAVESRFARDIMEVPAWLAGGPEPTTVKEGVFRADRLLTMRTRLSAAYKGIHALLMREGARDFRSGKAYDQTVFFDEWVDIHHIFPQAWCGAQKIDVRAYDTVINKTPLSYRTNRIIGGDAPSRYLARLEQGRKGADGQMEEPPIPRAALDGYLQSHCIPVQHLRADDFESFMKGRRRALLDLIAAATGHPVSAMADGSEEGEELSEEALRDSGFAAVGV